MPEREFGGCISIINSTSTPLGIDEVFTGVAEEITHYGVLGLQVFADQASATDGLCVEFSTDKVNWDVVIPNTIVANVGETYNFRSTAKYFRVVYTNGGIVQTAFRLQTSLKQYGGQTSSGGSTSVTAAITGMDDQDISYNVMVTSDGNLAISDNSSGLAIAQGNVTGVQSEQKFGNAPDFDITDGEVTITDSAEDGVAWELMNYVYSTTADIDSVSSTDSGDTGVTLSISGLDINLDPVDQTIALDGTDSQVRVALTTALKRIHRVENISNGINLVGHVIVYVNTAIVAGVPTDKSKIRCVVHPENNQTEMVVRTVPNGYTGYMRQWWAGSSGSKKDSRHTLKIFARPLDKVFQLKHRQNFTSETPVSLAYKDPVKYEAGTDIEMRVDTDADGVGVSGGFDMVFVADV